MSGESELVNRRPDFTTVPEENGRGVIIAASPHPTRAGVLADTADIIGAEFEVTKGIAIRTRFPRNMP